LKPEHEEGEKEYRRIALRFVEMANEFLKKLGECWHSPNWHGCRML